MSDGVPTIPLEMRKASIPSPGQPLGHPAPEPGFIRPSAARRRPGRPALGIPLDRIIEAVRRTGKVMAVARELGCSDAYIHVRFRRAGLILRDVLDAPSADGIVRMAQEPESGSR